jgi:serine/threonine-protein kinase
MGDVHLARYEALPGVRKLAAVKVLRLDAGATVAKERLLYEARVTAHLAHPNVVQLLDAGIDDGVPWIALELVAGVTLRETLDRAKERGTPLSPWIVARVVSDALAGLHAVHEARDEHGTPLRIVHRDLSPQNILVTWDGVVKIADFGFARSAIQSAQTTAGTIKGKLGYMSPEQVRGGDVDRRADVFAMGVVLWEALAREALFVAEDEAGMIERALRCEVRPLRDVAKDAPESLAAIAHRALSPDPSGRFWTALEMRQALDAAMAQAGVTLREPEIAETLALLLPDRVREHESWLSDPAHAETVPVTPREGAGTAVLPPIASPQAEARTAALAPPLARTAPFARAPEPAAARPLPPGSSPPAGPASPPSPLGQAQLPSMMYRTPPYPPAPAPARSPWKYVLIGAAVAGTFAGIFGAGAFFLLRTRSELRTKPATVATAAPPAPAVPPAPAAGDPSLAPVDETPPPPGTPASSLRARPPWGKLDRVRTSSETVTEYAPQMEKPLEVFMAASPLGNDPIDRGLLVCRVQTFAKADTFAGDDLHVRVAFGSTPLVANDGPEDGNLGFVTAPLASLKKGEAVRFEVYDRDVFSLQPIAKPSVTWNGGPLTVLDASATIECRRIGGDPLNKLAAVHAAAADQSVGKVRATKLDGRAPEWGWPVLVIGGAQRSIGEVAGLVGWDDTRVRKRVAALDTAIASLEAQKPQVFESIHATASESAAIGGVTVKASGMTCANHGAACTIKVGIKNDGDQPISLSSYGGVTFYAANARSGPQAAQADVRALKLGALDPGASFDTTVEPARSHDLGNGPAILGVCKEGRCAAIKLR